MPNPEDELPAPTKATPPVADPNATTDGAASRVGLHFPIVGTCRYVMVGSFGEVQVMDWGLAKVLTARPESADPEETLAGTQVISLRDSDGSFTQAGSVLGTVAFMPPEQAAGAVGKVDQRSDVFGLG